MKIYLLSPESVPMNPVLFPTFEKTFRERGHEFVGRVEDCDVVFFDFHTRVAEYNQYAVDWVSMRLVPVVTFDEWDRGGMSSEKWPNPITIQQLDIFSYKEGRRCVHFCRLLDKTQPRLSYLYPYEKPILFEEPIHTPDELFNREFDIVWIANTAPQREALAKALREEPRLKCNIILGATKIPYHDWIAEHRKGKLFISCSAGGYSNECVQSLFSVSGHLRERTDQLLANPFTDLVNCIKTNAPPTKQDLDKIVDVVSSKEKLYDIYLKGYNHVKKYYSEEYMADYVLDILAKNGIE